jgi:protease-4
MEMSEGKPPEANQDHGSATAPPAPQAPPAPPQRRGGRGCLLAGLAIIGAITLAFFVLFFIAIVGALGTGSFSVREAPAVAVIRIEGEITGDRLSVGTDPETIIEQLKRAERDENIKSILLRINSPGGSAAASQEIAMEVARAKKPVVASIGDSGASGAYWIATACDRIVAAPASSVGSIGVIMMITNLKGLFEKLGVKYVVVAKGKFKDLGNPARDLTDEEKKLLSDQAEMVYRQFINDVARNRKMSVSRVEELATGQVFVGEEAKKLGLVDELGNYRDALKIAARLGKIEGEAQVIDLSETPASFMKWLRYILPFGESAIGGQSRTVIR